MFPNENLQGQKNPLYPESNMAGRHGNIDAASNLVTERLPTGHRVTDHGSAPYR